MRKKTFFKIGHMIFEEKNEPPILMKKIKAKIAKRESDEYKRLRIKFNEDRFDIINFAGQWIVKEKE